MKFESRHLPLGLLIAYLVYSGFVPVGISHSVIVLSLAALSGYQLHISRQETHKYNEEVLKQLKNELEAKLEQQKEFYAKKISKLEDETAKLALNHIPPKVAVSPPQPRKIVF